MRHHRTGSIPLGGGTSATEPPPTGMPDDWPVRAQKFVDGLMAAYDRAVDRAGMLKVWNQLTAEYMGAPPASDTGAVTEILDAYVFALANGERRTWFDYITHSKGADDVFAGVVYHDAPEPTDKLMVTLFILGALTLVGGVVWFFNRKKGRR